MNSDLDSTEDCSSQYSSAGSDNGLAPVRLQAIIWNNDGKFTNAYMRHSVSTG